MPRINIMKYVNMLGGIIIVNAQAYEPTVHTAFVGKKEITVRSLIPVFASIEDKNRKKKDIESGLYKIFEKYVKT